MEWNSIEEKLPDDKFKKYLVKQENGNQIPAYFMPDRMSWVSYYKIPTSYWMSVSKGDLIYNVTHWAPLKNPNKTETCYCNQCVD